MEQVYFYLTTLGCKVNQYETEAIREAWIAAGMHETSQMEDANIIVLNTCAITGGAEADVRSHLRRMQRVAPKAKICLTGCAAVIMRQELHDYLGIALIVDNRVKERLMQPWKIYDLCLQGELLVLNGVNDGQVPFTAIRRPFPKLQISNYTRSRAILKVQDGCSHGCTYCVVPAARGAACSRHVGDIIAETRRLLEAGFRELVISGINLRQYKDAGRDFWDMLKILEDNFASEWQGKLRFRISSLEPGQLGERAFKFFQKSRLVAPHLHLSLQSGSSSVLQRMGRGHYNPSSIAEFLEQFASIHPTFALGADILTGFPCETEEEFQQTVSLCHSLPFSYAHVFPFSARPNTLAAGMTGQINAKVKQARAAKLRTIIQVKKQAFIERILSLPELSVVFENESVVAKNGIPVFCGVSEFYVECQLDADAYSVENNPHRLVRVCPVSCEGEVLRVSRIL